MRRFCAIAVLLSGFAASTPGIAWAATLNVDFDYSGNPVTPTGWESFAENQPSLPVTQPFAVDGLAVPGEDVDVTLNTNGPTLYFRSYQEVSGYGLGEVLEKVLRDHVLINAEGVVSLTLENLLPGEYEITTYHHATRTDQVGNAHFDLAVTDALGTRTIDTGVPVTIDTDLSTYTSRTFRFMVLPVGGSSSTPVTITFDSPDAGKGDDLRHFALNGFQLAQVPEPSASVLAAFGAFILLPTRYRRRRG